VELLPGDGTEEGVIWLLIASSLKATGTNPANCGCNIRINGKTRYETVCHEAVFPARNMALCLFRELAITAMIVTDAMPTPRPDTSLPDDEPARPGA